MIQIQKIIENQKKFFATGKTLDVKYRKDALKKLKSTIEKYEVEIGSAINTDLGKSASESYMCEIGLVKSESAYMIKHLNKFAREKFWSTLDEESRVIAEKFDEKHGFFQFMRDTGLIAHYDSCYADVAEDVICKWVRDNNISIDWDNISADWLVF